MYLKNKNSQAEHIVHKNHKNLKNLKNIKTQHKKS